jgi:hypothetical protein
MLAGAGAIKGLPALDVLGAVRPVRRLAGVSTK